MEIFWGLIALFAGLLLFGALLFYIFIVSAKCGKCKSPYAGAIRMCRHCGTPNKRYIFTAINELWSLVGLVAFVVGGFVKLVGYLF